MLIDEVIVGQQFAHNLLAKVLARNAVFPSVLGSGRASRALQCVGAKLPAQLPHGSLAKCLRLGL